MLRYGRVGSGEGDLSPTLVVLAATARRLACPKPGWPSRHARSSCGRSRASHLAPSAQARFTLIREERTGVPAPLTNARRDKGRSGLVDHLVVPALLLAGHGWEAAQPALRSPRAR